MHHCIRLGQRLPWCEIIAGEEEIIQQLMEMADQCRSSDDIWTVACGDVSLFYYHTCLVPSFFGLDLVRFDYEPTCGRILSII